MEEQNPMKMQKTHTARGFALYKFQDSYGEECTLQKSSLATDHYVWLGCEPNRMHLSRADCEALIKKMNVFVETGEI